MWPLTIVQTCIIHLIRNTFRLASKRDWDAIKRDVKPIYTAAERRRARAALEELAEKWGTKYAAIIRFWDNAWEEFIPFLDYDVEIRTVICSTNAIESLERPLPPRGPGPRALPDRAGRLEVSVSGHQIPRPHRQGRARWTMRWKPALNAFAITFADRCCPSAIARLHVAHT